MTDKHARRPSQDGHRRRSQDHHQPNAQPTTPSSARTAQQLEQGQIETRPSATLTSAYPVVASPASRIASSATPPIHDRRDNTTLVHAAQNVAPATPWGSELLRLTEIFIDRANVNRDDPRVQISIMSLQNAIARQEKVVRRLKADLQRRASEYDALKAASDAIPEREVQLENRVEALDQDNRQLRWANRQLQQLGPFVQRQNMQIDQKSWHIQEQDENRKELEDDNEKLEQDVEELKKQVEDLKKQIKEEKAGRQQDRENYNQKLSKFKQPIRPTETPTVIADPPRSRIFDSAYVRGLDPGPASSASPQPITQATTATGSRSERDAALPDRRRSLMARAAEYTTTPPTRPRSTAPRLPERHYARARSMSPLRSPPQRDFREARAPSPPVSRRYLTETIRHRPEDAIANPNRDSPSTALSRYPRRIAPGLNDDASAGPARLGNHTVETREYGIMRDVPEVPFRKLTCVNCHRLRRNCDGGVPCNHCMMSDRDCYYQSCRMWGRGEDCKYHPCTLVHDEYGYPRGPY